MNQIKAVINDIDGNLTMTEEVCWRLENGIFQAMDVAPMTHELHMHTRGMKVGDAVEARSQGKADLEKFWQLYPGHYQQFIESGQFDITPEVHTVLQEIRSMGLQHFVLSSRNYVEMKHFLDATNPLSVLVDAFYYQDNMQYHKPDPRAFAHIEEEHGLKPAECVYVGDQPGDAAAAKGAGLHFIANLEEGLRTREDFADYPVDAFINRFTELPEAIMELERSLK